MRLLVVFLFVAVIAMLAMSVAAVAQDMNTQQPQAGLVTPAVPMMMVRPRTVFAPKIWVPAVSVQQPMLIAVYPRSIRYSASAMVIRTGIWPFRRTWIYLQ